jgi:hypothetical protein
LAFGAHGVSRGGLVRLVATALVAQGGTLRDARLQIEVRGDTARVAARYRIVDADSIRFTAIRLSGQTLALDLRAADPPFWMDTLPGLFRLRVGAKGRGFPLEVRYRVTGDLARIPLLVPEAPTTPGQSRVTIEILGVTEERAARFVFPRFARELRSGSERGEREGAWLASPDHLPSFVAVVGSAGALPVPAMAHWSVLLLALGATGLWLLGQRRARPHK